MKFKIKKSKTKKNLAFLIEIISLLLFMSVPVYYNFTFNTFNAEKQIEIKNDNSLKTSDIWPNCPTIYIKNDNWSDTNLDWVQNRTGTYDDPHIIENVTINAGGYSTGIKIEDSDDYFIIRNCTIYNADLFGIYCLSMGNGTFINNTIYNNEFGIIIENGFNLTLSDNIIEYNGIGMYLQDCNNFTFTENTVRYNDYEGIYCELDSISDFNKNKIVLNKIYNNGWDGLAIIIYPVSELNFEDNWISNNQISGNHDDGFQIEFDIVDCKVHFENNIIDNNTIYDNYGDGITIGTDVELYGNSNITFEYNFISNNQIFKNGFYGEDEEEGLGIRLGFDITDNSTFLFKHNQIIKNNISITAMGGILVEMRLTEDSTSLAKIECDFNNISENRLESIESDGINFLGTSESNSDGEIYIYNNTIANNTIKDMFSNGIALWFDEEEVNNVEIYLENNTVINNKITRITEVKNFAQAGIYIDNSLNTKISNNEMNNCGLLVAPEHPDVSKLLSYEIINNKVNKKSLICRTSEESISSIVFKDAGQIVLINCNYTTISNLIVSEATIGISIYHCNNITIFNVTSSNGAGGFLLSYSNKNNISTNIANDNTILGILLYRSNYTRIENNDFLRNPTCIIEVDCIGNVKINNKCLPPGGGFPPGGDDDDDDDEESPSIHGYNFVILLLVNFIIIIALSITLLRKKTRRL